MMTKDPVCGMEIDEKTASRTSTVDGHTYYFCSDACKTRFDQEPGKFASTGGHVHR
jgi:YHS domain-containing protein